MIPVLGRWLETVGREKSWLTTEGTEKIISFISVSSVFSVFSVVKFPFFFVFCCGLGIAV